MVIGRLLASSRSTTETAASGALGTLIQPGLAHYWRAAFAVSDNTGRMCR